MSDGLSAGVRSDANSANVGMDVLFQKSAADTPALTESDLKKAKLVWEMLQKGKKWKAKCGGGKWQKWWDFWKGRQWEKRRPTPYSMKVLNVIYEETETFVGNVWDAIPDSNVLPRNPDGKPLAETLTKLLNWAHDINEQETELELPVRSAVVTGTGVRRIDWDPSAEKFRGVPRSTFVDEAFFFVSPYAKKIEQAAWVLEAQNVPMDEMKRRFPDNGWKVQGGAWDGTLTPLYGPGDSGPMTAGASGDVAAFTLPDGTATQQSKSTLQSKDKDICTLIEAWIRQEDGTLRYLVVCNGIVLQDGPSPYADEKYPYVVYNVIRNKDSVFGHSLVELLESMQTELNEIHSYALDQQRYESDTPLVVNIANMEEGKPFVNAPGSVYYDSSQGQGYYLLQKPGANPKWFEMEDRLHDKMRTISGGVDVLHGENPAGVTTLGAMEIVRQQANVVVAKMARHVRAAVRREDLLLIERIKQFMKDERVVRVTGARGQEEFVTVNQREKLGPDGEWERENEIPDEFECDVDFSPVPPGGFQAKFERDMQLLQGGVVDAQFVLEDIDVEQAKIDALMERMAQQQQAAEQAELVKSGQVPPENQGDSQETMNTLKELFAA